MKVSDLVIVLIRPGSDFKTAAQNVSKLSVVPFGLNGVDDCIQVLIRWHVEATIPLAILKSVSNLFRRLHRKSQNDIKNLKCQTNLP